MCCVAVSSVLPLRPRCRANSPLRLLSSSGFYFGPENESKEEMEETDGRMSVRSPSNGDHSDHHDPPLLPGSSLSPCVHHHDVHVPSLPMCAMRPVVQLVCRRVGFGVPRVCILAHECLPGSAACTAAASSREQQQMESVPLVTRAPMPDKGREWTARG